MYGQDLELMSDPFEEGGHAAVRVVKADPTERTVHLPPSIWSPWRTFSKPPTLWEVTRRNVEGSPRQSAPRLTSKRAPCKRRPDHGEVAIASSPLLTQFSFS